MNRQESFEKQFAWQNQFVNQVATILKENAMYLVDVKIAPIEDDLKRCTDMIIEIVGGSVAVRLRNETYKKFKDFTIRSIVPSGYETEIDKLKNGFGDYYLYGWLNSSFIIDEWILVDLGKFRLSGLLDDSDRRNIPNKDGTKFKAYTLNELSINKCILNEKILEKINI